MNLCSALFVLIWFKNKSILEVRTLKTQIISWSESIHGVAVARVIIFS